jgi:hypothetical protein
MDHFIAQTPPRMAHAAVWDDDIRSFVKLAGNAARHGLRRHVGIRIGRTRAGGSECTQSRRADIKLVAAGGGLIDVAPAGDLILDIGREKSLFLVDSLVMAAESPVFRQMLFGPWADAAVDKNKAWVVALPEDDPRMFELVSRIVHGRIEDLPEFIEIGLDGLAALLMLTEKYDISHILEPWSDQLLNRLERTVLDSWPQNCDDFFRLLWVCWELCLLDLVEYLISQMAALCAVDEQGRISPPEVRECKGKNEQDGYHFEDTESEDEGEDICGIQFEAHEAVYPFHSDIVGMSHTSSHGA